MLIPLAISKCSGTLTIELLFVPPINPIIKYASIDNLEDLVALLAIESLYTNLSETTVSGLSHA
jgi:hypothetical protein